MAEEEKPTEQKKKPFEKSLINEARLIRILGKDIRGDKKVLSGLTSLKGISWSFSNAICKLVGIDPNKTIEKLTEKEIAQITEFVKDPKTPSFLMNRRKDYNQGNDRHLVGNDLDMQKDFDIKRLKKIKAYKGIRHMLGQPARGQRTKSHFRSNRKNKKGASGVAAKTAKIKASQNTTKPTKKK